MDPPKCQQVNQQNADESDTIPIIQTCSFQSSSYKLYVTFDNVKLTMQLEDTIHWVNYYREYTEQDVGKEINAKVELRDILQCFLMVSNSKIMDKKQQGQEKSLQQYQLGSIIQINNLPCFKIDNGAIITVYVCIRKESTKKIIKYQSILNLAIKYSLTEKQILLKVNQQNNWLKAQNRQLKTQRIKLKIQIQKLSYYARIRDNPYLQNFQITYTGNTTIKYKGNDKQWNQFILVQHIPKNTIFSFKIKIVKSINRQIIIGILDYNETKQKKSSFNSNNVVCYKGGHEIIQQIKYVNKSKHGSYQKYPNKYLANYNIKYFGNNSSNEGIGFKQGEIVQTIVNLKGKTVTWKVGEQIRADIAFQNLAYQHITYKPYFQMYNTDDVVELIQ